MLPFSDSYQRLYRHSDIREVLCIYLHGDYKYGNLKNTFRELDTQSEVFSKILKLKLLSEDLIVIGYSGRDKSLMTVLKAVYSEKGAGRLFWCGYGNTPLESVKELIDLANASGRKAYYIPADGFDQLMYRIATFCMANDKEFQDKISQLKKTLCHDKDLVTTDFTIGGESYSKIVNTNLFPIGLPDKIFSFKVQLVGGVTQWEFCEYLYTKNIMAIPEKDKIYAWGDKEQILQVCNGMLIGEICLESIKEKLSLRNTRYRNLVVKTITAILGQYSDVMFRKSKIWDIKQKKEIKIKDKHITYYLGIKLSLYTDSSKFRYISVNPAFEIDSEVSLEKDEIKEISRRFEIEYKSRKLNSSYYNYIDNWLKRLVPEGGFKLCFPIGSNSQFIFNIRYCTGLLGLYSNGRVASSKLPVGGNKRIVFKGMEFKDPNLEFYSVQFNRNVADFHPMRGVSQNAPYDYLINTILLNQKITLSCICPDGYDTQFYNFLLNFQKSIPVTHNPDYVISYPGFSKSFKTILDIPNPGSSNWHSIHPKIIEDLKTSAKNLLDQIVLRLNAANSTHVVLIFIPEAYDHLIEYSSDSGSFNLHDSVKAYSASKHIATQFVREKTLNSDLTCQIIWSLSLAIYVKSGRLPWVLADNQDKDIAYAGIGYSVKKDKKNTEFVVGCSHVYSAKGYGLKYKLSKINNFTTDKKDNPYLTESEAFKLGLEIGNLFYSTFSEIPKRVVIHKCTPFTKDEVNGIVGSLNTYGIKDIDLVAISFEYNVKCFELKNNNPDELNGFPVNRGLCFFKDQRTVYLFTHGIVPSVRKDNFKYFMGAKSIPLPLKIVKYYGRGTMSQIVTEILGLTKMNWNSFELYSKLPCTIESANTIAKLGNILGYDNGNIYDYRYFM